MSSPRTSHLEVVMHIVKHLKGASRRDILYQNHGHCDSEVPSDADWAGYSADRLLSLWDVVLF